MQINKNTIDFKQVRELLDKGQRVLLFMRHSERPEIDKNDKDFGQNLGLTENGVAMARFAGSYFKGIKDVEFFASPMQRCRLTAKHFAEGMEIQSAQIKDAPAIGLQGFYMQPDIHALQAVMRQQGYMEYMLKYLAQGTATHLNPIKSATEETIKWMRKAATSQLSVFVSHDIYITAFITALGIRTFRGDDWIGFLHGAVLSTDMDNGCVTCRHAVPCLNEYTTEPAKFSK